jgi:hypothetical protein
MTESELTGDQLSQVMATLANPHRLRVLAALTRGRNYVSRLAGSWESAGHCCRCICAG